MKQFLTFVFVSFLIIAQGSNVHSQSLIIPDSSAREKLPDLNSVRSNLALDSLKGSKLSKIEKDTILSLFSSRLDEYKATLLPQVKVDSLMSQSKALVTLPKLNLSGEIHSESFVTNYLDPFTPSEKMYFRVYGAPRVTVANLPFQVNFFYSTETNTYLNSNSIGVQFDVQQYKQNLKNKAVEKLSGYKKVGQEIKKDKELLEKQKSNLQHTLEQKKNDLLFLENELSEKKAELALKAQKKLEEQKESSKQLAQQKLQQVQGSAENIKNKVQDSLSRAKNQKQEEIRGSEKAKALDSLCNEYQKKKALYDSLIQKFEKYNAIYRKYKNLDSLAQSTIEKYNNGLSKDQIAGMATKRIQNGKIQKLLSATNRLDFGLTYTSFNKFSIHGASVKGIDYGFSIKNTEINLVGGRTFRNDFYAFNGSQPVHFDRNVGGISLDHNLTKSTISQSFVSVWDSKLIDPSARQHNFIYTLGYDIYISPKWKASALLAHSYASSENVNWVESEQAKESTQITFKEALLNGWAANIETDYRLNPSSKISLRVDQIQSGYQNIINPFLRKDNREIEAKISQKLFKRRVIMEANYKGFRDNLSGISMYTNRMQGYGFMVKSQFKKLPNFVLQYAPYEQGNNHPDSLFRTNNQLAVYSATVFYNTQIGQSSLTFMASAIQSHIDFSGMENPVNNELFNASVSLQSKHVNITLMAYRNQTRPVVDSLNFTGVRMNFNAPLIKSLNLQANGFFDRYDNKAYRYSGILGISGQLFSKLTITLNGEIGQIDGLYGLVEKRNVYSTRLNLGYQF